MESTHEFGASAAVAAVAPVGSPAVISVRGEALLTVDRKSVV